MRKTSNLLARESDDRRRRRRRCRCRRCHRRRLADALRAHAAQLRARPVRHCGLQGAIWDEERFREWARQHPAEATTQAGRFVARLLRDKTANQSVGYTARLHVAAWKAYGISVEQSVLDDLSRLTQERWCPATLSRLSALGARESDRFDVLEAHWEKLVEYQHTRESNTHAAAKLGERKQDPIDSSSSAELSSSASLCGTCRLPVVW